MNPRGRLVATTLAVALVMLFVAPAYSQFIQQGPPLADPGTTGFSLYGKSVALSHDGNTAMVGSPFDDSDRGAVYVYIRNNGVWSLQSKLAGPSPNGEFGWGVALSADGNTAIVSSFGVGAWILTRSGAAWNRDRLMNSQTMLHFPGAVALSADGKTALVGDYYETIAESGAWVFVRLSTGEWRSQGNKLRGTPPVDFWTDYQGTSLALSADGNTALIGGEAYFSPGNHPGQAWVFIRRNGVWRQDGPILVSRLGDYGVNVAVSGDGTVAVVGGVFDSERDCPALTFLRTATGWRQQGELYGTDSHSRPVALSSDGNTLLLGSYYTAFADVFSRTGSVWSPQSSDLVSTGEIASPWWPAPVALSGDGNTAILGWMGDNKQPAGAWVFTRPKPGTGPVPEWTRLAVPVGVAGGVSRDGVDRNFEAVAFGRFQNNTNMFVIAGRGGNLLTYNGTQVVNRAVGPAGFSGVAFNETGAAVAVGDSGWLYRSTDGVHWAGQRQGAAHFGGIAHGNGVFVAVQAGGRIFRSTDGGLTWQESLKLGQPWTTRDLTGVAFGNGKFVATAKGSHILHSADGGVTWTDVNLSDWNLIEGPGMYEWHYAEPCPVTDFEGIAFGHGMFVAVGANGAVFMSTANLLEWKWTHVGPAGEAVPLHGVGYGLAANQEYFVATGQNGVTLIGSVDANTGTISWTKTSFPTTFLRGVAFGMGRFVAVGYGATIVQSKPLPW